MKLASLNKGRDGQLLVVSRDLRMAQDASVIVPTLQEALDDWGRFHPRLQALYEALNQGETESPQPFDPAACASPLPRAYQWADGSAYVNHVELVRKARGAELPDRFWTDPLIYQGGSDSFLGPCEPIPLQDEAWGLDFEGEVAVVVDDVPAGIGGEAALQHIRLLMLVNDVSLRGLIPDELAKGFGFFQSKPSSAFSPVAVTPDELEGAWMEGRVHRPLQVSLNGALFGRADAGTDMVFHFGQLIAHAARTRRLGAGTIVGSGTVSNRQASGQGSSVAEGGVGYSCIAERRMIEILEQGRAATPFLRVGDRVEMEMLDSAGRSLFGRIAQHVVAARVSPEPSAEG